jgi:3D (Asp-Asp-Asp) domain-containing protein
MRRVLALSPLLLLLAAAPPGPAGPGRPTPGPGLGKFLFTFYWAAEESDFKDRWNAYIYDDQCAIVAPVSIAFLKSLAMEGTGFLSDGRLVNFQNRCICSWENTACFMEVKDERTWGIGVDGRALQPFRSVAVDQNVIPIGTKLYVPDLDGLEMPGEPPWGGFVHDGCLVADDRGSAIDDQQLDFYSARRPYYLKLDKLLNRKYVTVFDGAGICP